MPGVGGSLSCVAVGHKVLGQIHMDAEEFDEAVFQFKKAIELAQVRTLMNEITYIHTYIHTVHT